MSDKEFSLEGRLVRLTTLGSFCFTGRVGYVSETKIVLEQEEGLLVIYRDKIVAAQILSSPALEAPTKEEDRLEEELSEEDEGGVDFLDEEPTEEHYEQESEDDYEDMDYDEFYRGRDSLYGSIIPGDMLLESEEEEIPVSFSVSMYELKNPIKKGDLNGSSQKNEEDRGEDKE